TTRVYGGTGLGLAISSNIIQMMNGELKVESELGKGSCFYFTARFGVGHEGPKPVRSESIERLRGQRILIVDDNATNRRILVETLGNCDMQPTAVADGPTALKELEDAFQRQQAFTLILLDANMPQMDGFMLAAQIKANPHFKSVALMMLSSAASPHDADRCR